MYCLSILSNSDYKKWSNLIINSAHGLVLHNEHLVMVFLFSQWYLGKQVIFMDDN
jgi:hypothetical protein